MIGLLKSEEDWENVLHSRKNYENMIEQDKENNVIGNESEGIKKGNSENVNNKTQEKEIIALEQTTEKQITDDSDDTNLTIQIQTDSEIESAIQAEQDPIPKKIESIRIIRTKAKFNLENQAEKMKTMSADKYSNVEVRQNVRLKVPEIGAQGFKKCNCQKKCTCRSSGSLCDSECHNSNPCCNK
ncbi:hypothetical protein HHI36_000418 [Cryptolaemus montrouzieri]|uniref:Uncharacterized protein n=1 Tax=Cryptolaemus montrouzieri TaxID=559131 RepID=A0ABD2P4J9_9CUCU